MTESFDYVIFGSGPAGCVLADRLTDPFDAAERAGLAAVSLDGAMIDYPVVLRARRVLLAGRVVR